MPIKLTLINPCGSEDYLTIAPGALPNDISYTLYDFSSEDKYLFSHPPFQIITPKNNAVKPLCGELAYEATFDGTTIDTTSSPMSYTADSDLEGNFTIYSEDFSLIGNKKITVQAYLASYLSIKSDMQEMTIEIIDPCLEPFSLTVDQQD